MSGERALLKSVFGRAAAAVLTATVAFALAPVAAATPESDAADAVNRTYDASGGATGPMGPADGGLYPIGAGFGQNYAGGKIFFTPDTGAHIMGGAILQKYESLGGPADSDLGFPTIDEGPGKATDSRNTTFSAADKPVIFWTPDTGAHVVRGAINAAWDKLGGSAGPLGVPSEDEVFNDDVVSQKFAGGELSWNRISKEFATVPPELAGQLAGLTVAEDATSAINDARRAAGGALGPLGAKQGPQYAIGKDGVGQDFAGGKIFYTPATGANVVTGQVLKKYESAGGPQGDLGFPTSNEADGGLKTGSRVSTFSAKDKPVIFWTPDYGAFVVRGAMNAAWTKLGGATGTLGPPVADETTNGSVVNQRFTGGEISWEKQTNKFSTQPANLASGLSGLTVPGYQPPEAANPPATNAKEHNWFTPSWWWLLAGIPLAVLVALILVAALRNRNGGSAEHLNSDFDADTTHGSGAEADAYATAGSDEHSRVHLAESHARPSDAERYGVGGLGHDPYPPADNDGDDGEEFSALEPEPDESDTAPQHVLSDEGPSTGRHTAIEAEETSADDSVPAAATAAAVANAPAAAAADNSSEPQTAIHLPLADPLRAPSGYPIKADTKSGLYWVPESDLYDHVPAEVYFVNEDLARANGFLRAD